MDDNSIDESIKNISHQIDRLDDRLDDRMDAMQDTLIRQEALFRQHEQNDREDASRIGDSLHGIEERLNEYNTQLELHIRNSEANSAQLKILQERVLPLVEDSHDKEIVKKWSAAQLSKTTKILSAISIVIGVVISVVKLLGYF
ncbi:MAG: hypothetical protein DRI65_14955 [Chloroflexota bacterium]|nr:MAG: hypothetical protein DRI65_14955 [Chloroflexota bacterium]